MMYYRKFVKNILISALVPFLSLIAAIIIIDPLQVFHKSWIHPGKYVKTSIRETAYGIVKYEDFDSIIIGSSMCSNFSANEASQKLGGKFINLSMRGSYANERKILLKHLLNSKRIKIIINSFDVLGDTAFINNYDFLYGSFLDKLKFYYNAKTIDLVKNSIQEGGDLTNDFNHPEAWYQDYNYGMTSWISAYLKGGSEAETSLKLIYDAAIISSYNNKKRYKVKETSLPLEIINNHLMPFIKEYTDTLFVLFLPPWSKVAWKSHALSSNESQAYNEFEIYKAKIKYLVSICESYNNVIIVGFDNEDFTGDINEYRDAWHYSEKINSLILDSIKNKTNILNMENIELYLDQFEKSVIDFDIKPLYEQIKSFKGLRMLPC